MEDGTMGRVVTYQDLSSAAVFGAERRNATRGRAGSPAPEGGSWTSGVVAMA